MGRKSSAITLRNKAKKADISKYKPLKEFTKIFRDFSILPENNLETLEIGIFDRKAILATRLNDQLALTLLQTSNYIDVSKETLNSVWYRHRKGLKEGFDYVQFEHTYYLYLRGLLKILKYTRAGFADRFYDSIVDYLCDIFRPMAKSRYEAFRIEILLRDNYTCFKCGKIGNEIHHIWSQKYYPHLKYDPENVKCACVDCNNEIAEEGRKRFNG